MCAMILVREYCGLADTAEREVLTMTGEPNETIVPLLPCFALDER
jgi:hypothetical protein